MGSKSKLKNSFEVERQYGAIYAGGLVKWSSDTTKLYCQDNGQINVISVEENQIVQTIGTQVLEDAIHTFALSDDNVPLSSSLIKLWATNDSQLVKMWKSSHQGPIKMLCFNASSTASLIASGGTDGTLRIWDYQRKTCIGSLRGCSGVLTDVKSRIIYATGSDHVIHAWDYETREVAFKLPGHLTQVTSLSFTSDGQFLVSSGRDKVLILWNLQKQQQVRVVPTYETIESATILANDVKPPNNIRLSDDKIYAASASTDGCNKIWEMNTARLLYAQQNSLVSKASEAEGLAITQMLYNKKHSQLAVVSADHNILIHNCSTFHCSKQFIRFSAEILDVAFMGKFASVAQDTYIKVWRLPKELAADAEPINLNCVATTIAHKEDVNCITISPNDKMIATTSQDKTAKLWSMDDLSLLGVLRGHRRGIWCARFSPTDQVLMTTSGDFTIKLWSLADMSCLKSFEGHDSSVMRAEFLSQGMQLVSAGSDGLIKLWNIKSSECVKTMEKHDGRVWTMAIASDELPFISGGSDSLLIKWKDMTDEENTTKLLEQQEIAVQEQELNNLVLKALLYALRLSKPKLTLNIITQVIKGQEDDRSNGTEEEKENLLEHAISWNTNSRNTRTAQLVLNILLKEILSGAFKPTSRIQSVENMLPYTEQHFKRMFCTIFRIRQFLSKNKMKNIKNNRRFKLMF